MVYALLVPAMGHYHCYRTRHSCCKSLHSIPLDYVMPVSSQTSPSLAKPIQKWSWVKSWLRYCQWYYAEAWSHHLAIRWCSNWKRGLRRQMKRVSALAWSWRFMVTFKGLTSRLCYRGFIPLLGRCSFMILGLVQDYWCLLRGWLKPYPVKVRPGIHPLFCAPVPLPIL